MGAFTRLAQVEDGAACHHFAAMTQEGFQQLFQVEQSWLGIHQRHHVDAEHGLHRGVLVEVVDHDLGVLTAAHLDHHAHAVFVGLVAQLSDAVDLLVFDELGDALQQARFVHHVRQFRHDDGLLSAFLAFHVALGTHEDATTTGEVGFVDAARTVDDATGGEIRSRYVLHQIRDGDRRVVDQPDADADDFLDVVGRDVGGHAHGDAGGAVDQQVRQLGRQDRGFGLGLVVVGGEVDGLFFDVRQHLVGDLRHAHFGVTHGGRSIAVHGAEIALAIHQHIAHGERLGHAHDGVVHGHVAVGVVFTDDVADHSGRLLVGLVVVVAQLFHGVEDAAVNGL